MSYSQQTTPSSSTAAVSLTNAPTSDYSSNSAFLETTPNDTYTSLSDAAAHQQPHLPADHPTNLIYSQFNSRHPYANHNNNQNHQQYNSSLLNSFYTSSHTTPQSSTVVDSLIPHNSYQMQTSNNYSFICDPTTVAVASYTGQNSIHSGSSTLNYQFSDLGSILGSLRPPVRIALPIIAIIII